MSKREKCCTGCKTVKKATEFYKNRTIEGGLSIYCKECTKLNAKKHYQKKLIKEAKLSKITKAKTKAPKKVTKTSVIKNDIPHIETSLKLVMIEKHLLASLNLFNEFKEEYELLGGSKINIK